MCTKIIKYATKTQNKNLVNPYHNDSRTKITNVKFNGTSLHQVHTVHTVKSAVALKWQVGFENGIKMTPIFTFIFNSKMLIKSALHHWNILF